MIIRLLAVDSALAALAVVLSRAFFPRWIPGAAKRWRTVTAALALEWASWSPAQRVLANVVVVFAFAIRAYHMSQPIRYDEAYTYLYFAGQPLSVAVAGNVMV